MPEASENFPPGNVYLPAVVGSAAELGRIVRARRQAAKLRQMDLAGIGNTGNRLIVDIEKGKPTVQLQKVLDVLGLLGLELVVQAKAAGSR